MILLLNPEHVFLMIDYQKEFYGAPKLKNITEAQKGHLILHSLCFKIQVNYLHINEIIYLGF